MKSDLCYIGILSPFGKIATTLQDVKQAMALTPGVYRVTDHGEHLKINTTTPLKNTDNFLVIRVPDKTTHWDAKYWDFAMAAFRHATKKGQSKDKAINVMIHYLCNLFGVENEADYLGSLALRRARLDSRVTDKDAHGWELPYVEKLRGKKRKRRA